MYLWERVPGCTSATSNILAEKCTEEGKIAIWQSKHPQCPPTCESDVKSLRETSGAVDIAKFVDGEEFLDTAYEYDNEAVGTSS